MLEMQVLALDRQTDVAVLSWLMTSQSSYNKDKNKMISDFFYIILSICFTSDKSNVKSYVQTHDLLLQFTVLQLITWIFV